MLAPEELDELLDEPDVEPDVEPDEPEEPEEVLGADGLAVELLEEVPDESLVDVVDEVDGFDLASRESVR